MFPKKYSIKAAEVIGEFIGNKIADVVTKSSDTKIVKPKPVIDKNSRNVEQIIIPPKKEKKY